MSASVKVGGSVPLADVALAFEHLDFVALKCNRRRRLDPYDRRVLHVFKPVRL